jgi:quinol monooxygenase YgiN
MPIVVTVVSHPVEGRAAELVEALRRCTPAVHDEQGCRLYAIHDGAI